MQTGHAQTGARIGKIKSSRSGWHVFPPLLAACQLLCPGVQILSCANMIFGEGPPEQILMFDAFNLPLNYFERSAKSKGQMRPAYSEGLISYLLGKNKSNYRLHLLAIVASIILIQCHPRLHARLLPRVAKLPRRSPRRTKRRGRARGRTPLPSTSTRLYRLDTSKTLRILMYIRFQVLKQVHPYSGVSSMAISIMNSLR